MNKPIIRVPSNLTGPMFTADGYVNFASRVGTGFDKAAHSRYTFSAYDGLDLEAAYRTSWLRNIVDSPPEDEVREWRTWTGADDTQITAIDNEEKRLNLRWKVREARTLARKDGGAALLMGFGGNAAQAIDVNSVAKGGLRYVTVCSRLDIAPAERDDDPNSPTYGEPSKYILRNATATEVHPSRVIRFIGNPIRMTGYWDGWGESIWPQLRDAIKHVDQIAAGVAAMVDEAKLDVISLEGLASNLATDEGENRLVQRWTAINSIKSSLNALLLDAGDEYEQKTLTFQGLTDIQNVALMIMSGMSGIPATRLLGRSPQGMNATGESDMRNYYDRIRATQQIDIGPKLDPLDTAMIRSALGSRSPKIYAEWNPLYQMSEKEAAEVEKIYADAANVYATSATVPDTALIEIIKGGIIERGQWPGAQKAFDEAEAEGDEAGLIAEPTEAEMAAEQAKTAIALAQANDPATAAFGKPRLVATNDASPRTLYVRRDVVNRAEIAAWARDQGFKSVVDDMHVTIAMSSAEIDWMKIPSDWGFGSKDGEMTIQAGGARLVEPLGSAIALLFASNDLAWRHVAIREAGATWDFPEYQPHVSISYEAAGMDLSKVVPYRGKIVLGPEIFEERRDDIEHGES